MFSSPQVNPWFHSKSFHSRKYEYLLIIFISKYQFVITIKRTLSEKLPEWSLKLGIKHRI